MTSTQQIFDDPSFYPLKFDPGFANLEFLRLKPADVSAVTFLDDQNLANFTDRHTVSVSALENLAKGAAAGKQTPAAMIFHSAFCCSTLIARCLDIADAAQSLKEPQTLAHLANLKRTGVGEGSTGPVSQSLLKLLLGLYSRPPQAGRRVVIKPSNSANNLIEECLESGFAGNVILLYSDLETFLKSIIKKGLWGNIYARKLFLTIGPEAPFTPDLNNNPLNQLADLQVAALAWYAQISVFRAILEKYPADRVKSLNCDVFLGAKEETLVRATEFLEITANREQIQAILGGSVAESHAKDGGMPYSAEARRAENETIEKAFGDQLQMVSAWAGEVARPFNFPPELPHSL